MKRSPRNRVEPRRPGGISAAHGCRRAAAVSSPRRCLRPRTRLGSDRGGACPRLGALGECPVNGQPDRLPVQGRSEPNQAQTSSPALSAPRRRGALGRTPARRGAVAAAESPAHCGGVGVRRRHDDARGCRPSRCLSINAEDEHQTGIGEAAELPWSDSHSVSDDDAELRRRILSLVDQSASHVTPDELFVPERPAMPRREPQRYLRR
jgi:hypothetical protein